MKKLLATLSVIAVAGALVFGFGAFNEVKAVPSTSGERMNAPTGDLNLYGIDEAANLPIVHSRDAGAPVFNPDTYGLKGALKP